MYTCTVRTLYIYLGISQGTYQSVQTVQTLPEPLPETAVLANHHSKNLGQIDKYTHTRVQYLGLILGSILGLNIGFNIWFNIWFNIGLNIGLNIWLYIWIKIWIKIGFNVGFNIGVQYWV